MKDLIEKDDVIELMKVVKNTTRRDVAGILNPELYKRALSGTKDTIIQYLKIVGKSLQIIADHKRLRKVDKIEYFQKIN